MARGYTNRKLEVWSIHARLGDVAVHDYGEVFSAVVAMKPTERVWENEEKAVAIPMLTLKGRTVTLIAYEGPRGQPIIFDTAEGTERTQPLEPEEIVATRTHAVVDLDSREAIIEYNQRGAKAADIATVLGVSGRKLDGLEGFWVDFSPKVGRSFVEGIDAFERIRVAGFRIARPNSDWTDWDDTFAASAAESGAQSAKAEYMAPRGGSLSKGVGVVPFIRERAAAGIAALKNASITGRRYGENAETTITLGDHKEHQRVAVKLDSDRRVDEADIRRRLSQYYDERRAAEAEDAAGAADDARRT
jgi:hypothetical protein